MAYNDHIKDGGGQNEIIVAKWAEPSDGRPSPHLKVINKLDDGVVWSPSVLAPLHCHSVPAR